MENDPNTQNARHTLRDRIPLKHKLRAHLNSKLPGVREWAQKHIAEQERESKRAEAIRELRKKLKRERAQMERKLARQAPEAKIAACAAERLTLLRRATAFMRTDRQFQQLRGREEEVADWWRAMALAAVRHGRAGSDGEVAKIFTEITGKPCNRHQARGRRQIVQKLEEREHVWKEVADRGA